LISIKSLVGQTGYLEKFKVGRTLLYILIYFGLNRTLKFLVDTGTTSSFIIPNLIEGHNQKTVETPILITTALGSHKVNKMSKIKIFTEYNCHDTFPLLLFKFHNYFDGLIGMDTLDRISGIIDIPGNTLTTPNFVVKLHRLIKQEAESFNIEEVSKKLVMLPVKIREGTFFCEDQKISEYTRHATIIDAWKW